MRNRQAGYPLIIRGLIYRLLSSLAAPTYYETSYVDLGLDDGFSLAFSTKQLRDNPPPVRRHFAKHN